MTHRIEETIGALEWSADALDRLSELRAARETLDTLIAEAVAECRTNAQQEHIDVVVDETRTATTSHPVSWSQIGDALGVSRQTAWERYGTTSPRRPARR